MSPVVKATRRTAVLLTVLGVIAVVLTGVVALDHNRRAAASSTPVLTPSSQTTANPSVTPSSTPTPTPTSAGPTPTPTPTSTSPTPTSSASPTPTSSASPTPTPTQTPATYRQLIGLGDSVTAGTNCDCTDFVSDLASRLAKTEKIDVGSWNEGDPGATSADLLTDLTSDHSLRRKVADSDVVIITTGANDLSAGLQTWEKSGQCSRSCYLPDIQAMGKTVGSVVSEVEQLRDGQPTAILVTDYWNVYEDGSVGQRDEGDGFLDWSDTVTRVANRAICDAAVGPGVTCVDLYAPFKGSGSQDPTRFLSDDGDHPNAAGTKLIADALYTTLEGPGSTG